MKLCYPQNRKKNNLTSRFNILLDNRDHKKHVCKNKTNSAMVKGLSTQIKFYSIFMVIFIIQETDQIYLQLPNQHDDDDDVLYID